MKLRDPDLLAQYMEKSGFSVLRLSRYAGCSRQFVYMLVKGERKTCTERLSVRIEEALGLLPGTLFVPGESTATRRMVNQQASAA